MIGRLAYAVVFVIALPVSLVAWAKALDGWIALPMRQSIAGGVTLAGAGLLLWAAGVHQFIRRGGGLPMNAYPPPRLVTTGAYAVMAHPIYVGWVVACAGVAWACGSAAGFWVVTPVVALGCTALVFGLERPSLRHRFGADATPHKPWLSLPPDAMRTLSLEERLAFWFTVLLPWLLAYEGVKGLGVPPDAIDGRMAFELDWPVWLWTAPIYVSAYFVVLLVPFLVLTAAGLRRLSMRALVATAVLSVVYLVVPIVVPFKPFEAEGFTGWMLAVDQYLAAPPMAAWPAFHAIWAAFVAEAVGERSPQWAIAGWIWAIAVAASCITTGMHAIADLVAAAAVYPVLRRPEAVWRWVLDDCERIANSWRAWRFGRVRVINHGVYAGLAGGIGVFGMGVLAGPEALTSALAIAASALVGAGLWAQLVEGSSSLQRPFGYFGALLGGLAGALLAGWLGEPAPLVLAAAAAVAPWVQAIGRLRCLAQGCCHGAVANPRFGIRVHNPHSRVVALARMAGQSIHPTQVYSIAGNVVIGLLLIRLWQLHVPVWFVSGAYLVLTGLARFVEEGYRGEPQTRRLLGLPIYQYLAVASLLTGAALTTLGGSLTPTPTFEIGTAFIAASVVTAIAYWFAMGVDFPESNRRFARLSG